MLRLQIALSVLVAAMAVGISAAPGSPSVSGQVKDDKGQEMVGVMVSARNDAGKTVTVPTKFDGSFTISALTPGMYEVQAVRQGYVGVPMKVDVPASGPVKFTLKPGPVSRLNLSTSDLQKVLPDGKYKEQLLGCEICHSWTGLAAQRPHQLQDWINGINVMIANNISRINREDVMGMAQYLQEHFGADSKLAPKLAPEPIDERGLNIRYTTYDIPTRLAMPHTAVPDGKGNVWFTEFGGRKIGRVNVKTGKMDEFRITGKSFPRAHGLDFDSSGNVWFAEQGAGSIGRFDPSTNSLKHYDIPPLKNAVTPKAGAVVQTEASQGNPRPGSMPHTLILDKADHVWITASNHPIRKLDPKTGEFTEYVIREGGADLYGITVDPKTQRIWYAGIGINEVGYITPATGKVTRFSMLTPDSGPRRIHVDPQGVAWCNLYNVNKIARIDPSTGKITEWNVPGARDGNPYPLGLDSKGRVWTQTYRDDRLHMFDPKTERFVSYLMPQKGNGLRDFFVDEEGTMWAGVFGRNQVLGFKLEEGK